MTGKNKLYILLAVLISLIFFMIAATCNLLQPKLDNRIIEEDESLIKSEEEIIEKDKEELEEIIEEELIIETDIDDKKTLAVIIDEKIYDGIYENLQQFEEDLKFDNYNIIEKIWNNDSPLELREYLKEIYLKSNSLMVGAFFIGDLPKAYYRVYYPETEECLERGPWEFITFEFYQDLDGEFGKSNPDSFKHEYTYDTHTGEIYNEIWIGVLPFTYDKEKTIDNINFYFVSYLEYN